MLERLLELLLHAKSGVFAGILLVGTTGALVTATVATVGNVTTITLTQASESPSANVELKSPAASPRTPKPTPTEELSSSPSNATATTTTSATTCTPDQNANAAVKTVDTAFTMYHTDLMHLRTDGNKGDAGKTIIEKADKHLKQIRQDAVKAIHAAASCKTDTKDDEDKTEQDTDKTEKDIEDQNEDTDPTSTARSTGNDSNLLVTFFNNLFGKHGTTTPTTVTGDAQTLADNAVAAMKVVFTNAKSEFDKLPTSADKSHEQSDKKSDKDKKGQSDEHKSHD